MTSDPRTREPNGASSIYKGADGFWHGRVTVGVRDDGRPDRRHVMRKAKADVVRAVRDLERQRDGGSVRSAGRVWTVGEWLTYWVEEIAGSSGPREHAFGLPGRGERPPHPGGRRHRLDRLEPEHLERLYAEDAARGQLSGYARTRCTERSGRRSARRNDAVASRATRPRSRRHPEPEEIEVEPYTVEEVQRLLNAAGSGATVLGGLSRWRSGFGRVKRWGCAGRTSIWTAARCASGAAGSVPR